jgi:cytoskeletal protein RodZ
VICLEQGDRDFFGGNKMKKVFSVVAIVALAAALLPAAFAQQDPSSQPNSSAPQTSQPSAPEASQPSPSAPQTESTPPSAASSQTQSQTSFSGTVVKADDKYVLKTDTATYQLDDQEKAKQFEGKQVMVSGSLDQATGIIHITDIQPANQK